MDNFDKWNNIKKQINNLENKPNFSEREIWYCNLGLNIGDEQNGKGDNFLRPVIVFRKFNRNLFWAIPLTKNIKNSDYYFTFSFFNYSFKNEINNSAILSQIKLLDSKRLLYKVGFISKSDFNEVNKKFQALLPRIL